jgi:hypothetical protein
MCLLASANRALGNKPWNEKADAYKKSILRTTNQLTKETYPVWNSTAVEKRQSNIAELAVDAWKWP